MKRNWANLPDSFFIGKFACVGFPYWDNRVQDFLDEFIYVKVTGTSAEWLVGILDGEPRLRTDMKPGDVIHFLKSDIEKVMGVP